MPLDKPKSKVGNMMVVKTRHPTHPFSVIRENTSVAKSNHSTLDADHKRGRWVLIGFEWTDCDMAFDWMKLIQDQWEKAIYELWSPQRGVEDVFSVVGHAIYRELIDWAKARSLYNGNINPEMESYLGYTAWSIVALAAKNEDFPIPSQYVNNILFAFTRQHAAKLHTPLTKVDYAS